MAPSSVMAFVPSVMKFCEIHRSYYYSGHADFITLYAYIYYRLHQQAYVLVITI